MAANRAPFQDAGEELVWNGEVMARKKSAGEPFKLVVEFRIKPNRYSKESLKACLCKDTGIEVKDFLVAALVDTRLSGSVSIKAPPGFKEYNFNTEILKLVKALEENATD